MYREEYFFIHNRKEILCLAACTVVTGILFSGYRMLADGSWDLFPEWLTPIFYGLLRPTLLLSAGGLVFLLLLILVRANPSLQLQRIAKVVFSAGVSLYFILFIQQRLCIKKSCIFTGLSLEIGPILFPYLWDCFWQLEYTRINGTR